VSADSLLKKVRNGDVLPAELIVGVSDPDCKLAEAFREAKVIVKGVNGAMKEACNKLTSSLASK